MWLQGAELPAEYRFAVDQSAAVMVDGEAATVYDLDTHSPQQSDPVPNVAPLSTSDPWLLDIKEVLPPPSCLLLPSPSFPNRIQGLGVGREQGRGEGGHTSAAMLSGEACHIHLT